MGAFASNGKRETTDWSDCALLAIRRPYSGHASWEFGRFSLYGLSGMSTNFDRSAAQREESQDGEDSVMDSVRCHGRHQGAAPLAHQAESNRDGHQGRDAQPALRMDRRENEADDKHAEQDAQNIAKLGAGLAKLPIE